MKKALLALALFALFSSQALAQATRYWDINGSTAGAGGSGTPSGTWSTSVANWNPNSDGTGVVANWSSNNNAQFSAGVDAINPYTVTVSGTISVNTIRLDEGATVTFTGGTLNFTGAAGTNSFLTGIQTGVPTSAVINSVVTGANGFRIARNLGLNNVVSISNTGNNWSGPTTVGLDTTLKSLAAGVIPNGSAVTVSSGGTLDLNNFNETVATVSSTGSVKLGSATLTLAAPAGESFGGVISGTGNVVKSGSGDWTITAVNTYSGNTTLNAGTVHIDGDATFGTSAGTLNLAGGNINTTANRSVTSDPVAQGINMTANTTISTTSTAANVNLNLSSNSVSGTAGTLTFRNDGAAGAGTFDPRFSGSGFDFSRPIVIDNGPNGATRLSSFNPTGTTQTFSGDISGNGSYRRSATSPDTGGDTILSGNNSYTGGTANNGGGIGFGSNTAVGTGGITTANDNASFFAAGGARTIANSLTLNSNVTFKGSNKLEMTGSVSLGAATRTVTVTNTQDTILSGVVSNGGLTKAGGGTLILTGTNTYAGVTNVNGGRLQIDGNNAAATGTVTVNNGGTLGGIGTIGGAVVVKAGGKYGAGDSIGTMNFNSTFSYDGGEFDWEYTGGIYPTSPPADGDVTNIAGALTINALAVVGPGTNFGTNLNFGMKFVAISYDSTITGTFGNAANLSIVVIGGKQFVINYNDTKTGAVNAARALYTNAVTLTAVPEASSILVMGVGGLFAIGAVWLGRRYGLSLKV